MEIKKEKDSTWISTKMTRYRKKKEKTNESVKMKKLEKQAENADYIMGVEV